MGRWCRETDPRSPTGVAGLSRCWYCRGAPEVGSGSGEGGAGWGMEEVEEGEEGEGKGEKKNKDNIKLIFLKIALKISSIGQ